MKIIYIALAITFCLISLLIYKGKLKWLLPTVIQEDDESRRKVAIIRSISFLLYGVLLLLFAFIDLSDYLYLFILGLSITEIITLINIK